MRMRRKRGLDERIANQTLILAIEKADQDSRSATLDKSYIDREKVFGRIAPLQLEVGCGKGGFIIEKAKRTPEKDFLALERLSNVMIEGAENATNMELTNLRFLNCSAEYISKYLTESSLERIYVHFPTPLPNSPSEKQRLTSPRYVALYHSLLQDKGELWFKTDKQFLYEYTLDVLANNGFRIFRQTTNLHQEANWDNIITEYEKKFSEQGDNIFALIAQKI